MSLKNNVDVAAARKLCTVVCAELIYRLLTAECGVIAVMDGVDDDVNALYIAKAVGLLLYKLGKLGAGFEVDALNLITRNGGVAIADCTDDTDFQVAALNDNGGLTIFGTLVGGFIVYIDCKEGKVCRRRILSDIILAPIVFVVAEGHGNEAEVIHPVGDKQTLCNIGLCTSLPHIARGDKDILLITGVCAEEVGRHFVNANLRIGVKHLTVQVIYRIDVKRDYNIGGTGVAKAVGVGVDVHLLREAVTLIDIWTVIVTGVIAGVIGVTGVIITGGIALVVIIAGIIIAGGVALVVIIAGVVGGAVASALITVRGVIGIVDIGILIRTGDCVHDTAGDEGRKNKQEYEG